MADRVITLPLAQASLSWAAPEADATAPCSMATFALTAVDESGQRVAGGEIDRVVVDRARFLGSLNSRPDAEEEPSGDGASA